MDLQHKPKTGSHYLVVLKSRPIKHVLDGYLLRLLCYIFRFCFSIFLLPLFPYCEHHHFLSFILFIYLKFYVYDLCLSEIYIYLMLNEDRHLMMYLDVLWAQQAVKYPKDIQGPQSQPVLYFRYTQYTTDHIAPSAICVVPFYVHAKVCVVFHVSIHAWVRRVVYCDVE